MLKGWLVRAVLILWLVCSAFIVYFLRRVDWIVHTQLYSFGLRFSLDWAQNYWAFVTAIYMFLTVPIVLSVIYLGLDILGFVKTKEVGAKSKIVQQAQAAKPVPVEAVTPVQAAKPVQASETVAREVEAVEANHMLISCPHCKRVFSRPLVMLDFSGGKTRLVNVCPYCNHTLFLENSEVENRKSGGVEFVNVDRKEVVPE